MKTLFTILLSYLFITPTYAVIFEVKNICEDSAYHTEEIEILNKTTVGHLTMYSLTTSNIDFIGNEHGLNSLLNTPVGLDAYEILSDTNMKVYGWCYSVNGVEPDILSSEVEILPHSESIISWYYGYAELVKDEWISYCTPVYKNPTDWACKK